jgi:hypothetical protein
MDIFIDVPQVFQVKAPQEPIKLVYYRYDDDVSMQHPRWWLNWLAAKATKSDFIHVEIVFQDGWIYGVQMGSTVRKVYDKTYHADRYTCQEIPTNSYQAFLIRKFLDQCIDRPSGFNYWGFYLLPLWPFSGASKNKWFCSELVATALTHAGIEMEGEQPHTISPGKLFELIKKKNIGYVRPMIHSESKPLYV